MEIDLSADNERAEWDDERSVLELFRMWPETRC